ncbi:Hypothetical predicted protein [Mytilus galloprovincialis]|uniref:RNase H type-1 domain-containing protein n=1 Tax=Mytilus galloprovincialis TaxID=29158 RepID=A0A8B6FUF8_MYTGA|nr:Hypothetical predicted protein [Mytilus galloprovincialis]
MGDCTQEQAISFIDGSCLGNPGPCGSGAIIYAEHIKPAARLHRPVAQRGSILLAELIAIFMVLEYCITENIYNAIQKIKIFSDSQSAVGLLTLNWAPNSYISVIREIKENIEHLRQKGLNVIVAWTPGHANIVGNDEAAILAKTAAEEAKELRPENNVITLQDVTQPAYKITGNKWQRRWEISERGRDLYEKIPTKNTHIGTILSVFTREMEHLDILSFDPLNPQLADTYVQLVLTPVNVSKVTTTAEIHPGKTVSNVNNRKKSYKEGKYGVVIVVFKSLNEKRKVMDKKRNLKDSRNFKDIFIENDLSESQRILNNNLRNSLNAIGENRLEIKGGRVRTRESRFRDNRIDSNPRRSENQYRDHLPVDEEYENRNYNTQGYNSTRGGNRRGKHYKSGDGGY